MMMSNTQEEQQDTTATTTATATSTAAVWCPEQQIYIGGTVPGASNEDVEEMINNNNGYLFVFGYGSLCWNPGIPGQDALAHPSVTSIPGFAQGYRRCWAQKSTDHRGYVSFPGIVCTLLHNNEYDSIVHGSSTTTAQQQQPSQSSSSPSSCEGMIYKVPPELVQDCLSELDFREKGGYAREIIRVTTLDENTIQALLYRGTPDNPAFWPRVVWDLPLAAAVMAVSIGPSGPNDVYLNQLNEFLLQQTTTAPSQAAAITGDDTCRLAKMTKQLQQHHLYFLYGCGSNQHGQINIINNYNSVQNNNNQEGEDEEDIPKLSESVLWCNNNNNNNNPAANDNDNTSKSVVVDPPQQLLAGGGHSGLLTKSGRLYLWGWNQQGQCGGHNNNNIEQQPPTQQQHENPPPPMPLVQPVTKAISNTNAKTNAMTIPLLVQKASLGFAHTLIIEKDSQKLFAMGDNTNGQVIPPAGGGGGGGGDHNNDNKSSILIPTQIYPDEQFIAVAAGVFHSAAITNEGELWTWGSNSHGQCGNFEDEEDKDNDISTRPTKTTKTSWIPKDGSKLIDVVCGRHHTAVLDDVGRIWTFGDNKYGQLGRQTPTPITTNATTTTTATTTSSATTKKKKISNNSKDPVPRLVDGHLGKEHNDSGGGRAVVVVELSSGWSHIVARVAAVDSDSRSGSSSGSTVAIYGWGRSDKGQLGCNERTVSTPRLISDDPLLQHNKNNNNNSISQISCGSESTYFLDTSQSTIYSCGWNEHGNLGILDNGGNNNNENDNGEVAEDVYQITQVADTARIVSPPTYSVGENRHLIMAAGGAHLLVLAT